MGARPAASGDGAQLATSSRPNVSRSVSSDQNGVHRRLITVVDRRATSRYLRPIAPRSEKLFNEIDATVKRHACPVILDSCCGTGMSSRELASVYPGHVVVGIDKSLDRLSRGLTAPLPENLIMARGDCIDIWRLAELAGWPVEKHFLLYPNPWPKARHLGRRWHGHPVFGTMVALGKKLEVRSNWRIYIDEFALALKSVIGVTAKIEKFEPLTPLTAFERKYHASGHELFRLRAAVEPQTASARPV